MRPHYLIVLFLVLLSGKSFGQAETDETLFMSVDAAVNIGYAPWKSFKAFRDEYNRNNDTALKNKLGNLSTQYGFDLGTDFFVTDHLITAVDFSKTFGTTKAVFENGAERIIKSDINTITASIGWLQQTNKGFWTISSGFSFAFGVVKSSLRFPDGTKYTHTGGLSGTFHDVAVAVPLKFELARNISERLLFKLTLQGNYYFLYLDDGMQNEFVTPGESTLVLNEKAVKFDASALTLSAGLTYKIFRE